MQTRRDFFRKLIGGVATAAAVRTWPFRVYSFPSELSRHSFDVTAAEWKLKEMYSNQQWLAWDEEKQLWYPSQYFYMCEAMKIQVPLAHCHLTNLEIPKDLTVAE